MITEIIEIEKTVLPKILSFIHKSKNELIHDFNLQDKDIRILIPKHLFECFIYYHERMVIANNDSKELTFYGLEFSFHFKNEIVVYTPEFYWKKLNASHKILEL